VASTGGPESSYHPQGYNRYFFDAFLPPYEQTAALCGMRFLPPMLLHGANSVSETEVAQHIETFRQRLQSYPRWPELDDLDNCTDCEVPAADRPENQKGLLWNTPPPG
jgi:glutathione-regulated potassium-efflux system ancillary protein KefF